MKSIVVVGAQWGDEGKGKVVDYMAASFDYIARCAGGHNAGHTVIYDGKRFVLQLIPCGILRPGRHAVIGSGVVVDPAALVAELDTLAKRGDRNRRAAAPEQPRAFDLSRITGRWKWPRKRRAGRRRSARLRAASVRRTKTRWRGKGCASAI